MPSAIGRSCCDLMSEADADAKVATGAKGHSTRRITVNWSPRAQVGGLAYGLVFQRMDGCPAAGRNALD
jgi:hypothetical protein